MTARAATHFGVVDCQHCEWADASAGGLPVALPLFGHSCTVRFHTARRTWMHLTRPSCDARRIVNAADNRSVYCKR